MNSLGHSCKVVTLVARHQEQFWRISGELLPVELRCRARALELPNKDAVPKKAGKLGALLNMVKEKKKQEQEGGRKSVYKRCVCACEHGDQCRAKHLSSRVHTHNFV